MTRVLIIGSSHVGAYKNAAEQFAAIYPQVELGFFGVRGPLFLTGKMDKNGVFTPPLRDDKDRDFVAATNGGHAVDASGYDHILLVGHRFDFNAVAALLEHHDILEGVRTGRPRVIERAFFEEVLARAVTASVDQATAPIAAYGRPATYAMAPYPAHSITERGAGYDLARLMGAFWNRSDAGEIMDQWLGAVKEALSAKGHTLLQQPEALNAAPHATRPEYAARAAALDGALGKTDHRHMNADYGLAMLCAYAETHLRLNPLGADHIDCKERSA